MEEIMSAVHSLRVVKESFAARGWFPATSGNLSVLATCEDGKRAIVITASGKDKSLQTSEDFLLVDRDGVPVFPTRLKPSAETMIHTAIYDRLPDAGAVFHVHTVANNLLSELYGDYGEILFSGHELIKAFNIWEEDGAIRLPIVENKAHIPTLAQLVRDAVRPQTPGILIRRHGIYAWGRNPEEAKKHLEAFEFLFDYHVKLLQMKSLGLLPIHSFADVPLGKGRKLHFHKTKHEREGS